MASWPQSSPAALASDTWCAASRWRPISVASRARDGGLHARFGAESAHLTQAGEGIQGGDAQTAGRFRHADAGAQRIPRHQQWQQEGRGGEQRAHRHADPGGLAASQQRHRWHHEKGGGERQQDAQIEAVQRLDVR